MTASCSSTPHGCKQLLDATDYGRFVLRELRPERKGGSRELAAFAVVAGDSKRVDINAV